MPSSPFRHTLINVLKQGENMRSLCFRLITSLAAIGAATTSFAAPVTYAFSGKIVDSNNISEQVISGSFALDPAALSQVSSNGPNDVYGIDPAVAPTAAISHAGGEFVTQFSGPPGSAAMLISKNDGSTDHTEFRLKALGVTADQQNVTIVLRTFIDGAPASTIFPGAASGDLAFDQAALFNAPGTANEGWLTVYDPAAGTVTASARFTIDSVTHTSTEPTAMFAASALATREISAVPEPQSLLLTWMGVITVAAACRSKRRRAPRIS